MREPRSLVDVRRKDRQVDDEAFIRALLHRAPMGVLATARDGQPFVNSYLFVYDEPAHVIYMHTAATGRTHDNVEREQHVCFTVSEMGRLLPAERAFSMSVEYNAVVVFGRARIVDDEASKRHALDLLVRKYFPHLAPGDDYALPDDGELKLTAAYRIEIDAWSGKQKKADDTHPGAFRYGDHGLAAPSVAHEQPAASIDNERNAR
jgi:nitroimidazol reductase NimA-like FMN-containing flavoprotein (pyridoxamine 5'-phosphate oxidase superfamily)